MRNIARTLVLGEEGEFARCEATCLPQAAAGLSSATALNWPQPHSPNAVENEKDKKISGGHTALLPMRQCADAAQVGFKLKAIGGLEAEIKVISQH